jgi:hypothetical protein
VWHADGGADADADADEVHFNTPLPFFQNGAGDNMAFEGILQSVSIATLKVPLGIICMNTHPDTYSY